MRGDCSNAGAYAWFALRHGWSGASATGARSSVLHPLRSVATRRTPRPCLHTGPRWSAAGRRGCCAGRRRLAAPARPGNRCSTRHRRKGVLRLCHPLLKALWRLTALPRLRRWTMRRRRPGRSGRRSAFSGRSPGTWCRGASMCRRPSQRRFRRRLILRPAPSTVLRGRQGRHRRCLCARLARSRVVPESPHRIPCGRSTQRRRHLSRRAGRQRRTKPVTNPWRRLLPVP